MNIILGVGDFGASNKEGDVIKTFALGSCISVVPIDIRNNIVGMVHVALPDSSINPAKSELKPGYFADTGILALLYLMRRFGSHIDNTVVKLIGGANVMDPNNTFNIGKRNAVAIKSILQRYNLSVLAEDVGGNVIRTVSVTVGSSEVLITSPGRSDWKI